jgi:hypothetical protein
VMARDFCDDWRADLGAIDSWSSYFDFAPVLRAYSVAAALFVFDLIDGSRSSSSSGDSLSDATLCALDLRDACRDA